MHASHSPPQTPHGKFEDDTAEWAMLAGIGWAMAARISTGEEAAPPPATPAAAPSLKKGFLTAAGAKASAKGDVGEFLDTTARKVMVRAGELMAKEGPENVPFKFKYEAREQLVSARAHTDKCAVAMPRARRCKMCVCVCVCVCVSECAATECGAISAGDAADAGTRVRGARTERGHAAHACRYLVHACMCVSGCVHVSDCACTRSHCVCARTLACVRACVRLRACACMCVRAFVYHPSMCVCTVLPPTKHTRRVHRSGGASAPTHTHLYLCVCVFV